MEQQPPTFWKTLTDPFAKLANTVKTAIVPKPAQPLISDAAATNALGAESEPVGKTITGGRRRRTRKGRKGRKTRRGHRKH